MIQHTMKLYVFDRELKKEGEGVGYKCIRNEILEKIK